MPDPKFSLIPKGHSEIKRPFPLVQDLFTFAEKHGINTDGFSAENTTSVTEPLPQKFFPLVKSFPGTYFITAYEDRRSTYYKEDTRHQLVRLSTVKRKASTDDRVREMDIKMKSGARADHIEVRTRELIKEQSFQNINQATGEEIEQPHGEARYTYDIDEDGKHYPKKLEYKRLDEGLFPFGDTQKPVRWVRNCITEIFEEKPNQTEYRDNYIIREGNEAWKAQHASIKTTIIGSIHCPQSLFIEIGYGPQSTAQTLYKNTQKNIHLIFHPPMSRDDHPLNILIGDPVYHELLKKNPNEEAFLNLLQSRITLLQEDWDKPQSIYSDPNAIVKKSATISS